MVHKKNTYLSYIQSKKMKTNFKATKMAVAKPEHTMQFFLCDCLSHSGCLKNVPFSLSFSVFEFISMQGARLGSGMEG